MNLLATSAVRRAPSFSFVTRAGRVFSPTFCGSVSATSGERPGASKSVQKRYSLTGRTVTLMPSISLIAA